MAGDPRDPLYGLSRSEKRKKAKEMIIESWKRHKDVWKVVWEMNNYWYFHNMMGGNRKDKIFVEAFREARLIPNDPNIIGIYSLDDYFKNKVKKFCVKCGKIKRGMIYG